MNLLSISVVEILVFAALIQGQLHEDARCKCICTVVNKSQVYKTLHITSVPPNNDCDSVVLSPTEERQPNNKIVEVCPRCQCKYESRNTTIIRIVVIIVVWIVSLLLIYMMFLICLDPLLNNRVRSSNYVEYTNEEVCCLMADYNGDEHLDESPGHRNSSTQRMHMSTSINSSGAPEVRFSGNVLNRVSHKQNKWKRKVSEQRKNIYDRHTMLN